MAEAHQFPRVGLRIVDIHTAIRKAQRADFGGAIELSRVVLDNLVASGDMWWYGRATSTLV